MKLVELNPEWVDEDDRRGVGVRFDCPVHGAGGRCSLWVPFSNPVDGGARVWKGEHIWERTGDTFEALTVKPSINYVDHWHGFITNGEVTTV